MEPVVQGRETLANVLEAMKADTRQFARRQRTWLRAVEGTHWHHPDERAALLQRVEDFLKSARK
jgi:tRNA A37 N6-isopentenylltransferase MiaA